MPRTHEETPYYIRDTDGGTYYVDTLEEALAEFTGPKGYRLTLNAGENKIVIRRGEWPVAEQDIDGSKISGATINWYQKPTLKPVK